MVQTPVAFSAAAGKAFQPAGKVFQLSGKTVAEPDRAFQTPRASPAEAAVRAPRRSLLPLSEYCASSRYDSPATLGQAPRATPEARHRRESVKTPLTNFAPLIQVFDMPTSVAFYRDVLGFTVVETSPERGPDDFDWGLLRRDGIDLMLNTAYDYDDRPAGPVPSRIEAHSDTGLFFGCRELDLAYEHLHASGVDVEPPRVAPYGMRQVWLKDPDGYVLCLQWPAA